MHVYVYKLSNQRDSTKYVFFYSSSCHSYQDTYEHISILVNIFVICILYQIKKLQTERKKE